MIKKTKEAAACEKDLRARMPARSHSSRRLAFNSLKKLEFGVLEFFVGLLMIIGLAGYFGNVSADLDWMDHTISFILFSYLFYKLDITSILFGKTSKFANFIIIISYFSLFFKNIIVYTSLDAFKFKVITFVNEFYNLFNKDIALANIATIYFGIAGIFIISVYLSRKIEISHPSFLYAIHQKQFRGNAAKFALIFVLLLAFYYFVYSIVLEWLEFTLDDPIIAAGIVFYLCGIAKHHKKFHANNFVFKIGEFSETLYTKFVSLFHYKKTLPLAVSGLLILHALSDLGVFAYSLTFLKENFYLEFLNTEHTPFLKLFLEDAKNVPSSAVFSLFINYFLNALSLIIFLLIPVIIWAQMFSKKEFHFNRILLFFVYSSAAAYILLPGYIIKPIEPERPFSNSPMIGVDISSVSLLKSNSILSAFFSDKISIIIAVSLISLIFGLVICILSRYFKIRKELYALSIIGGLTFYTITLFYYFKSLLLYFYESIFRIMPLKHFIIGIILLIFLALSIIFYIGGYLMFLYEIVMEYHQKKWSEPIDNGLVEAMQKIKRVGRKKAKNGKI